MPGCSGASWCLTRVFTTHHARLRVHLAPGIPHALVFLGRMVHAKLGRITPRDCKPVSRRHCEEHSCPPKPRLRAKADATKQSSFLFRGAKAGFLRGACHRTTRSLSSGAHSRDPLAPARWLAMTVLGGAVELTL